jgi:hypothetical protein
MGTPGPEELGEFLIQQEMWQRFGATSRDLENWPRRKVDDYALIIQLIRREEAARARRPRLPGRR